MRRDRSPLPPILGINDSPSRFPDLHPTSFSPLPSLAPSPREVYEERELLVEQKFLLLSEIHQLRAEVSTLGAHYQKTAAAYDEQFEADRTWQSHDAAELQAHALTTRQVALQRENEALEDRLHYLMHYFGAEAADQIRVEVAVEKHAVKLIRAQLEPLAAARREFAEKLNSEELRQASEKAAQNRAGIRRLASILNRLRKVKATKKTDSEKRKEDEIDKIAQQLADLKIQKLAKQTQLQNLEHSLQAEQQAALNHIPNKMLRAQSVYTRPRFPVNLKEQGSVQTTA